ncbi:MAG TPA: hypothetical protein VFC46_13255, partial [Humisphaera sp.]|nr:hypothetical protein [Humisphaera sp.]
MTTQTDGRPETRMRWHSRCVLLASLCLLPLLGSLVYAQSAWPVAIYRLIVDGGVTLFWIAGATGLGMFVCRAMRLWDEATPASLRLATSAAAGLGLLSLAILGLGLAGLLNFATAWGLIALGWIAGIAAARSGASVFAGSASSLGIYWRAVVLDRLFGMREGGRGRPPSRKFAGSSRTVSLGTREVVRNELENFSVPPAPSPAESRNEGTIPPVRAPAALKLNAGP